MEHFVWINTSKGFFPWCHFFQINASTTSEKQCIFFLHQQIEQGTSWLRTNRLYSGFSIFAIIFINVAVSFEHIVPMAKNLSDDWICWLIKNIEVLMKLSIFCRLYFKIHIIERVACTLIKIPLKVILQSVVCVGVHCCKMDEFYIHLSHMATPMTRFSFRSSGLSYSTWGI